LDAFIAAFGTLGFAPCLDGSLQIDIEKVALFGKVSGPSVVPTHAALQLETGEWTSKMGVLEDIVHAPVDAVGGPVYGQVVKFLSRPRTF
jgi:hypothetical protein